MERVFQFIEDNSLQFSFGKSEENSVTSSTKFEQIKLDFTIKYPAIFEQQLQTFSINELPLIFCYFDKFIQDIVKSGFDEDLIDEFEDQWKKCKKRWGAVFHDALVEIKYDTFVCDDSMYPFIRMMMEKHMVIHKFIPDGHEMCVRVHEKEHNDDGAKLVELCYINRDDVNHDTV